MTETLYVLEDFNVPDDGLVFPDVGPRAEDKYRLISLYDQLFSKGMKGKWDARVYIDLYAGAGCGKIKGTGTKLMGSPLIALSVDYPFDKYIFVEQDPTNIDALRLRVKRLAPKADAVFINGSCDECAEEILRAIPRGSSAYRVLSLCFVDPFDFSLKFDTLRRLSVAYMDFMILLAAQMDANRNFDNYFADKNTKIAEALGRQDWRRRWATANLHRSRFPVFLAEQFAESMTAIGYLPRAVHDMKLVKTYENNMALYYLALFSKNQRAYDFWKEVLKYGSYQRSFWE